MPSNLHGIEAALIHEALDRLESLPVVKDARCDPKYSTYGRVICNMWCGPTHEARDKQPHMPLNKKSSDDPTAVPNYLVAAEKLYKKIESEHAGCVAAAEAARIAAAAPSTRPPTDAMAVLMAARKVEQVAECAEAASTAARARAAEARQALAAVEQEAAALERSTVSADQQLPEAKTLRSRSSGGIARQTMRG